MATVISGAGCSSSSCKACNGLNEGGRIGGGLVESGVGRSSKIANGVINNASCNGSSKKANSKTAKTAAEAAGHSTGGGNGGVSGSSSCKRCWKRKNKGSVIPIALHRREGARFTFVYSHGNATDIGAMHDRCAGIADALRVNVLSYDYTGYGMAG